MEQKEYVKKVIDGFIREITDNLFLYIEQDDARMREYMTNVNRFGLDTLNIALGTEIANVLHLVSENEKNTAPKSRLIKGYTCHKPPA